MCRLKDPLRKTELKVKLKNYKKIFLRLMPNSKSKHFNNSFHKNKLIIFKT